MTMTREAFFECSFTRGRNRTVAHVRAWTIDEAKQAFRDFLASEGYGNESGEIVVHPEGDSREPAGAVGN